MNSNKLGILIAAIFLNSISIGASAEPLNELPLQGAALVAPSVDLSNIMQSTNLETVHANTESFVSLLTHEIGLKKKPLAIIEFRPFGFQTVMAYKIEILSETAKVAPWAPNGTKKLIARVLLYSDSAFQDIIYQSNIDLYVDYENMLFHGLNEPDVFPGQISSFKP